MGIMVALGFGMSWRHLKVSFTGNCEGAIVTGVSNFGVSGVV